MKRSLPLALLLFTFGCGPGGDSGQYDVGKGHEATAYDEPDNAAEAFVGSWTHSTYVSPQEVARLSEDPIPPGVEVDMTLAGANTYHVGGRYDADAEVTIHIRAEGQDIPLKMLRREAGTWEIHNDVLVETVTSGTASALDATTEAFLSETPEFSAFVTPIAGETQSSTIESVSHSAIDLQERESQLRVTLRRKN